MLAPARNNVDIDFEQFDQQQQPRRLQPPPPPAMQPDPNAASANDNIVQIPRSMINVARRQQHLINADNLVSQDSNGSSGTGHEDSGPEHRLDRHADEQPGPSNSIPSGEVSPVATTSPTSNVRDRTDNNTSTSGLGRADVPYKLCILKYIATTATLRCKHVMESRRKRKSIRLCKKGAVSERERERE